MKKTSTGHDTRGCGQLLSRLLRKNTSPARIAGFLVSNFLGLAIVLGALKFYSDANSIWSADDSFVKSDWLVINKKVTSANTFGESADFTPEEIADLERQPWVRSVGRFTTADFRIFARMSAGNGTGRSMSTSLFFESIPDEYVDVDKSLWRWKKGSGEVPVIISRDYLTLYNFGFASSAGLPQMSEGLMSGIPLELTLTSEDGTRMKRFKGHVAGYSNRLNTILVPDEFMRIENAELGSGATRNPSRLVVDVNSPGDVAISEYLEARDLEVAGDKSGASASFLLKVVTGVTVAIGAVITLLSFFILLLSLSLIMEKNATTLHRLLMLGYDAGSVAKPYTRLAVYAPLGALFLALCCAALLRGSYLPALEGLGADSGSFIAAPAAGAIITLLVIIFNVVSVRRKVRESWRR